MNSEAKMRRVWRIVLMLPVVVPVLAYAAEQNLLLELNAAENADNRCRLTFLIENKGEAGIESIKFDFAVFNREGIIHRRMATELGPVRGAKTNVRTFIVDGDCGQIGSILVNDITACTPGSPSACLDALALSSRITSVRLYK
jgi:hypothetical protein